MNGTGRRSRIPGGGSEGLPERYSWRARLGFIIGGAVVIAYPVWLLYHPSWSVPASGSSLWVAIGMWWTLVAGCLLAIGLARIFLGRTRRS